MDPSRVDVVNQRSGNLGIKYDGNEMHAGQSYQVKISAVTLPMIILNGKPADKCFSIFLDNFESNFVQSLFFALFRIHITLN